MGQGGAVRRVRQLWRRAGTEPLFEVLRRRIPVGVLLIRNIGRPRCYGGEGRGGAERGEAAREGRPGRCGAGHARLAGRNWERQRRRGAGGGRGRSDVGLAWRVGPMGCAWTAQGEHSSRAGGTPLFPQQQPSGEHPSGGAEWAAALRVTAAEILQLRIGQFTGVLKIILNQKFHATVGHSEKNFVPILQSKA